MSYDVFISYSRKNTNIADEICAAFDKAGIHYYKDLQDLGGATDFSKVLKQAIIDSKIVLFIASKEAYQSKFTQFEIQWAFDNKKTILPYFIDDAEMPLQLQFILNNINWRNKKNHPISVIVEDILSISGKPTTNAVTLEAEKLEKQRAALQKKQVELVALQKKLEEQKSIEAEQKRVAEEKATLLKELEAREKVKSQSTTFNVNGVSFDMIAVEGGTFWMGAQHADPYKPNYDSDSNNCENPIHQVTLSDYMIGKYEVTQELWQAVMGSNPSRFKGGYLPVEKVSWNDAQEFITKLNQKTGQRFRLPTEAEWEFAARGGNKSKGYKYSGSNTIGNVAWYEDISGDETHPVGQKMPNELGIYDMSGNVWEWCQDWYGDYGSSSQTNPTGPSSGSYRVLRGGSWGSYAMFCRVSYRNYDAPDYRYYDYGFRVVLLP